MMKVLYEENMITSKVCRISSRRPSSFTFPIIIIIIVTMIIQLEQQQQQVGMLYVSASSPFVVSNNRMNYHPYQYDLTIPQFTPDGRLLQVEYAQMASTYHSVPIIIGTMVYPATTITTTSLTTEVVEEEHITIYIAFHLNKNTLQSRIVVLPKQITNVMSGNMNSDVVADDDNESDYNNSNIIILISGIVSDAYAILQLIQNFRLQEYRTMGSWNDDDNHHHHNHIQQPQRRIANYISSQYQSRTLSGGKRPYGATIWITTTIPATKIVPSVLLLQQIDPSGTIIDIVLRTKKCMKSYIINTDDDDDDISSYHSDYAAVTTLGGDDGINNIQMQRRLQQDWVNTMTHTTPTMSSSSTLSSSSSSDLLQEGKQRSKINHNNIHHHIQMRIGHLLHIAMEEYQQRYLNSNNNNNNSDNGSAQAASTTKSINNDTGSGVYDHLEVVMSSSQRGTIKLSSQGIHSLIQQYQKQQNQQQHTTNE